MVFVYLTVCFGSLQEFLLLTFYFLSDCDGKQLSLLALMLALNPQRQVWAVLSSQRLQGVAYIIAIIASSVE